MVFQQRDVGVAPDLFRQGVLHRMAGGVGGVDDAAVAVAAFARQVVAGAVVRIAGERHALLDQPFDRGPAVLHDEAGGLFVAQPGAGDQGVADVRLDRVVVRQHGGDAALRPVAGAVQQSALGDDRDSLAARRGSAPASCRPARCR